MAGLLDIDLAGVEFMKLDQESPVDPDLSFHLFPSLPYELRLDIIEEWLRSRGEPCWAPEDPHAVRSWGTFRRPSRFRNPLAEHATIDRQWKYAVERETFRSLRFVIPDFGRNTPLEYDDVAGMYRLNVYGAFDEPDELDHFQTICTKERINAVLKLRISANPHVCGVLPDYGRLRSLFLRDDNNLDEEIVQIEHVARVSFEKVLQTLERFQESRFQESRLKSLDLDSSFDGLRWTDPMLTTPPSLHLSQSLYAMTCRLEELDLRNVVNVPYFLAQSWAAKGTTQDTTPAWPKLRVLWIQDYVSLEPSDRTREAAELHKAVTKALPQLPNLTKLYAALMVPYFVGVNRVEGLRPTSVWIQMWPRDDDPAMRDGDLRLRGPAPEPETIDLWRQIARRQWDCNLQVGVCTNR